MCKRWTKFENFLADMGTRPVGMTLERKNNDKGYSKRNCVWATQAQQNNNRRSRKCGYIRSDALMYQGRHIRVWMVEWNVSYGAARNRILRRTGRL